MVQKKLTTDLTELLLQCVAEPDPMLKMLEWLCEKLMEAEISAKTGADKSEHATDRQSYRSGYRPRRFDTRMGTIYLMVPKVRQVGYIPFFVNDHKRKRRLYSGCAGSFCERRFHAQDGTPGEKLGD